MKLFRMLLICLLIAGFILYNQGNKFVVSSVQSAAVNIQSLFKTVKNDPEITDFIGKLGDGLTSLKDEVKDRQPGEEESVNPPSLSTPEQQTFSIHNIELGETKEAAEKNAGKEQRASYNEYGVKWHSYHENYQNFFMVAYDDQGKVAGLYTNDDLISSKVGIKLGDSKDSIAEKLGEPLSGIRKGFTIYQIQNNGEYGIYELDDSYVTVFFDKHKNDTVTALQIISKDLEQQKKDFFGNSRKELEEGFEYQLFDLTNAARVKFGLPALSWDDHVKVTARGHSSDMAANDYFSHDNLSGQSPFDRLKQDRIAYIAAGENIAAGQVSSIFAHEGLMNSMGHRENILSSNYNSLGVGVAFDSESKPFYTENFIGK